MNSDNPFRLLTLPLAPFVPGQSFAGDRLKLAFISLAATAFFLFVSPYYFPGGASHFTAYADFLVHGGTVNAQLAQRDVGYPLLLVLSGYPFTGSFVGISLISAGFSFLMPLLIHAGFGEGMRWTGFYAAMAMMASCIPYLFIKMVHHDHTFLFFMVLTLYFSMRYLANLHTKNLYGSVLSALMVSLTRPAGNLFAVALFGFIFLATPRPRKIRHFLICLLIFAAVIGYYSFHRQRMFAGGTALSEISYSGRQVFYNLYVNSRDFGIEIDPSLGPATAQIIQKVRDGVPDPRYSPQLQAWLQANGAPQALIDRFSAFDRDGLVAHMLQYPSFDYFDLFSMFETDDRVYFRSALEIVRHHPLYAFRYTLRNLLSFLWTPGYAHTLLNVDYQGQHREAIYFQPFHGAVYGAINISDRGLRELKYDPLQAQLKFLLPLTEAIETIWKQNYTPAVRLLVVLSLIGAVASFFESRFARDGFWLSFLYLAYNAVITSAFAEPNYRYHFFIVPFLIVCAAFGMRSALLLAAGAGRKMGVLRATSYYQAPAAEKYLPLWGAGFVILASLAIVGWTVMQHVMSAA